MIKVVFCLPGKLFSNNFLGQCRIL